MGVMVLDWAGKKVELSLDRSSKGISLNLGLYKDLFVEFRGQLSKVVEGEELKLILPVFYGKDLPVKENWTLYFKESAADKTMAAHPTEADWVGSFLLSKEFKDQILNELGKVFEEQTPEFILGRLKPIRFPNNLDLKVSLLK